MLEVAKKGSESHHVDVNMAKTQLSSVKSGSLSHKDYQTTVFIYTTYGQDMIIYMFPISPFSHKYNIWE